MILGTIDDNDITYWNGKEVGRTTGYTIQRNYTVPGKLVKAGPLSLAIRIVDTGGGCGMPNDFYLRSANGEQIASQGSGNTKWRLMPVKRECLQKTCPKILIYRHLCIML